MEDIDQQINQNTNGFYDEPVPMSTNHETEPVLVDTITYQEKEDNNGFNKEEEEEEDYNNVKENNNISETDLKQLPAIPPVSKGKGLPFAPIDFPSHGDVWTWRVGKRVTSNTGFHKDRFLILPERLKEKNATKCFASKNTLTRYLETNFPDIDLNAFFASFSWNIPALFQPANMVETSHQVDNGEEGATTSRYSQRKRKSIQMLANEPIEPKANPRVSNRKKNKEKEVSTTTKQKPSSSSSSSRRSTRQQQGGVIDWEEEEKEEPNTSKKIKKRRFNIENEEEEEEAANPHIYVSPINGVIAVSHSPLDINPEEFDTYLNTLENLLQQSESSSSSLPTISHEWGEARKKLSSLLQDKDLTTLLVSEDSAEIATLATKLKKDPSLTAEETVRLKLAEEIPAFSEIFRENKRAIAEADKFFSSLELNKSKVASLKYEYNELKDKIRDIQREVGSSNESIREIDVEIARLQSRKDEITRSIVKKGKEKVDLGYGLKMVANSIPRVVEEVQGANSKKPEWECKKENALRREDEILNKFAPLNGFFL